MSKGYLLDTNIAIAILINKDNVFEFAQQASRDKMRLSSVVGFYEKHGFKMWFVQ